MNKRRRSGKSADNLLKLNRTTALITCKTCQKHQVRTNSDVAWVICKFCVQEMVGMPAEALPRVKSDRPRGWQRRRYYEYNGVVYSRGKEVSDETLIEALRNGNFDDITPPKVKKVKPKGTKRRGRKNASNTE
jgi:hypothetical protein